MLGFTRLSWGLLFILLFVNVALNSGRRAGAPINKKIVSGDKPRRPKASSELGPKKKGSSAAASSSAASRKPKAAPITKKKQAPVVLHLDDDEEEVESFSSSRDRRRGGASSDFSSFGNRAVKGARARRPLDEEEEDEDEEDEMPAPRGRARGGRRPLDEDDDEEEEDEEEEDMDEEDEEEEDFGGRYSRRSKPSKKKGKGGRYRGESKGLQPYKQGYQVNRVPLQARLMRNINILGEKVSGIATKGKKMTRELKEYFSGDFESMLLKVTRPDDQRPPEDVVGAILDATATFYRDEDVSANTNPYRVTLRKLWTKMAERDWRTVAKALYVFHVLLRECEPDDVRIFKKIYLKMCKEMCKKTKDRYFNIKRIEGVDPGDGQIVNAKSFIERYTKYVLQRAKTFTSKFEEMKVIGERDITPKDLVGQLLKAEKVIASGVECLLDSEDESEVTIMCVELVARDVHDLFRLFHDKLRWVLDNEAQALEGTDPEEVTKILDRFKTSYDEQYPKVQSFLAATADMLSAYGIKLKVRIEPKHNFAAEASGDEGSSGDAEADVDVAAAGSATKGGKGAATQGAYSNEEGTVEEEADLTAYDDATPWDGGAARSGAGRKAAPPAQDDDDDYEE